MKLQKDPKLAPIERAGFFDRGLPVAAGEFGGEVFACGVAGAEVRNQEPCGWNVERAGGFSIVEDRDPADPDAASAREEPERSDRADDGVFESSIGSFGACLRTTHRHRPIRGLDQQYRHGHHGAECTRMHS